MRVVYNACIRAEQTNPARPGIQIGVVSTFRPFQFNALHINSNRMCFIVPRKSTTNKKTLNKYRWPEMVNCIQFSRDGDFNKFSMIHFGPDLPTKKKSSAYTVHCAVNRWQNKSDHIDILSWFNIHTPSIKYMSISVRCERKWEIIKSI